MLLPSFFRRMSTMDAFNCSNCNLKYETKAVAAAAAMEFLYRYYTIWKLFNNFKNVPSKRKFYIILFLAQKKIGHGPSPPCICRWKFFRHLIHCHDSGDGGCNGQLVAILLHALIHTLILLLFDRKFLLFGKKNYERSLAISVPHEYNCVVNVVVVRLNICCRNVEFNGNILNGLPNVQMCVANTININTPSNLSFDSQLTFFVQLHKNTRKILKKNVDEINLSVFTMSYLWLATSLFTRI